jgi:serine/threonine-protein kinase
MLVFVVDNPVPGLEVRRDGALVPQASWGSPLPVDAGDTQVLASAPGYHSWQQTISVPAKLKEPWPVRVPALEKEATTAPAAAAPPPPAAAPTQTQPSKPANDGSTQRTVGLIVGGAGVVGLIVSGTLTILAANKKASSKDECLPSSPNQCSPAGVSARESATSLANVATVAGVIGGVAVAGGAVIYFTAPKSETAMPQGLVLNMETRF